MNNQNRTINIKENAILLIIVSLVCLIANHIYVFTNTNKATMSIFSRLIEGPLSLPSGIAHAFMGMVVIYFICMVGLLIAKYVPFYLPAIAWISLVAIIVAAPFSPINGYVIEETSKVNFLPLLTGVLAYSGFAIGQLEIEIFKKSGFKIVVVGLLVFIGTYLGSVIVAELILKATGQV